MAIPSIIDFFIPETKVAGTDFAANMSQIVKSITDESSDITVGTISVGDDITVKKDLISESDLNIGGSCSIGGLLTVNGTYTGTLTADNIIAEQVTHAKLGLLSVTPIKIDRELSFVKRTTDLDMTDTGDYVAIDGASVSKTTTLGSNQACLKVTIRSAWTGTDAYVRFRLKLDGGFIIYFGKQKIVSTLSTQFDNIYFFYNTPGGSELTPGLHTVTLEAKVITNVAEAHLYNNCSTDPEKHNFSMTLEEFDRRTW